MVKKTKNPNQLSFDLVFGEPVAGRQKAAGARAEQPLKNVAATPISENVNVLEATDIETVFDRSSVSYRETTAFDLYQRAVGQTRTLVLTAVAFALILLATKSGVTTAEKFNWFGFELKINDRSNVAGVLGLTTLLFSFWSAYSAWCASALWRKCGLFYQEITQPSEFVLIRLLHRLVWCLGLALIVVMIGYSLILATTDIFYLFVAKPSQWITTIIRH